MALKAKFRTWLNKRRTGCSTKAAKVHFFFLHFTMNDDSVMADLSFVKAIIVDGDFEMHNVNKGLKTLKQSVY